MACSIEKAIDKAIDEVSYRGSRRMAGRLLSTAAVLASLCATGPVLGQSYPDRPITIVAPYSVGGDSDRAARNFAAAAGRVLGQSVVVQNRPGASGIIGSSQVIAAPADGYTLLLARIGSQAILPAIMPKLTKYRWDDYTFIGTLEVNPYGCVVNAESPYKSFGALVDAIRTKGKTMNYGTAGVLTSNDMGPRLLFQLLKLPADGAPTQVPYKGTGDTATSLLGNETDFTCGSMGPFITLIQSGRLRGLMVATKERMKALPDIPTARELGFERMEDIAGWSAIFGPPRLPAEVVDRLVNVMNVIAKDPVWLEGTASTGSMPFILSPKETADFVQRQHELFRSLGESLDLIDKAKM